MRIRGHTIVDRPRQEVATRIYAGADTWVPIAAYTSNRHGQELLSDVGLNLLGRRRFTKRINVTVGEPVEFEGGLVMRMTWRTVDSKVLCAALNGRIKVATISDEQTHLTLDGTCKPPLGIAGRLLVGTVLHGIVDAVVRDFVERVRYRLEVD